MNSTSQDFRLGRNKRRRLQTFSSEYLSRDCTRFLLVTMFILLCALSCTHPFHPGAIVQAFLYGDLSYRWKGRRLQFLHRNRLNRMESSCPLTNRNNRTPNHPRLKQKCPLYWASTLSNSNNNEDGDEGEPLNPLDASSNTHSFSFAKEPGNSNSGVNVFKSFGPLPVNTPSNMNGIRKGSFDESLSRNTFFQNSTLDISLPTSLTVTIAAPPTAPEVNKWTTIMKDGTTAAFQRSDKKMTIVEAMDSLYNSLQDMSLFDIQEVERYWDSLMPSVSYLGSNHAAKVKEALRVAYRAHREQKRKSGEPFIIHPVEVALLLAGLKMDGETIMAGLLHDTVEDTDLTFDQIEAMFGHVVRNIVEGETKVSKLPKLAFSDYADEQAENLRQMFVAMTDDYRIIIVKLADRLHNMRTLKFMKPEKQIKISRETLDIFAPLAHRMGIWQFKAELEDTAFVYLYPNEYKWLNRRLRRHQSQFRETLEKSQDILRRTLQADDTLREQAENVSVYGRTKELYSLWYKMETKGVRDLNNISDVVGLRVIIEPKRPKNDSENDKDTDRGVWLCYHVLGLVQHLQGFQPVPTKVKDYISFPKPNGYQSLHTALMLNGQMIEVQIRTATMHQVAEYGMASHWSYTDEKKRSNSKAGLFNTPWLSSIKEWQDDTMCSRDFVDCVRRELLGKRVFVFLRDGKILNLAKGATVIDAAFQIHSEIGLNMHGVEINGKPVPFSYELKNGDVVSVLTGEGRPTTDWMRFATLKATRARLRAYFRKEQRQSLRKAGEILLMEFLSIYGDLIQEASFIDEEFSIPTTANEVGSFLPGRSKYNDLDELLVDIGRNNDNDFILSVIAKIFLVSLSVLTKAVENSPNFISRNVLAAVQRSRLKADEAKVAADSNTDDGPDIDLSSVFKLPNGATPSVDSNGQEIPKKLFAENKAEIADPENLCDVCLPVYGDDIIGTRVGDVISSDPAYFVSSVHRCGCPIAQKTIDFAMSAQNRQYESKTSNSKSKYFYDTRLAGQRDSMNEKEKHQEIVKLRWQDPDLIEEPFLYKAEVVVKCVDRKLLLADCSEVVSDLSEIIKTESLTTKDHATLKFLVKVKNVEQLQTLIDSLGEIPSVVSVERTFGSILQV